MEKDLSRVQAAVRHIAEDTPPSTPDDLHHTWFLSCPEPVFRPFQWEVQLCSSGVFLSLRSLRTATWQPACQCEIQISAHRQNRLISDPLHGTQFIQITQCARKRKYLPDR
jgi:hypothetical protein